jgi:hypothetical protein
MLIISKKMSISAKLSFNLLLLSSITFLTTATIFSPSYTQTSILLATSENEEDESGDGDGNGDSSDGDNSNTDQPQEEEAPEAQPQPQTAPQQQLQQPQQPQQPSPSTTTQQNGQQQEQTPLENFIISGKIVSLLPIQNNTWIADGDWRLVAENAKAKSFSTQMVWTSADGTQSHTHEFQNLRLLDNNTNVAMAPGITLNLDGVLDVGTNGAIDWPSVPARVYLGNGQTIVVAVDDTATNFHFGGQPVYGLVTSFSPCGPPGPSMEVLPRCE